MSAPVDVLAVLRDAKTALWHRGRADRAYRNARRRMSKFGAEMRAAHSRREQRAAEERVIAAANAIITAALARFGGAA